VKILRCYRKKIQFTINIYSISPFLCKHYTHAFVGNSTPSNLIRLTARTYFRPSVYFAFTRSSSVELASRVLVDRRRRGEYITRKFCRTAAWNFRWLSTRRPQIEFPFAIAPPEGRPGCVCLTYLITFWFDIRKRYEYMRVCEAKSNAPGDLFSLRKSSSKWPGDAEISTSNTPVLEAKYQEQEMR
jgi:hypothetical protein